MITNAQHQYHYKRSEKGKETQARYHRSEAKKANNRRWREKNREKIQAHNIFNKAVREGEISRQPCEKCGEPNAIGHHDDYAKPLDVRWLCAFHHWEHHHNENLNNLKGKQ